MASVPAVGTVAPGLRPESAQTTIKYGPPPAPGPGLKAGAEWVFIGAMGGVLAYLMTQHLPHATTPAATTNPNAVLPVPTSSGLGAPGTPVNLRELGATAHSVIVDCTPVTGATGYRWYLYGTRMPLAFSPTNTAVIQGLQANTAYDVVCTAVGPGGQESAPSAPLLIRTTTARPQVYLPPNAPNVRVVIHLLQQASSTPSSSPTPTSPLAYPVAWLVSDTVDYALARAAGVPAGALYYVGSNPYANRGYQSATFLPLYTGASNQPQQTVVVGLAGEVKHGTLATLEGQTRTGTNYLIRLFIDANPWTVQPTT